MKSLHLMKKNSIKNDFAFFLYKKLPLSNDPNR